MASLLQAVRNAGANNVVILGAWRTRATSRSGWPWWTTSPRWPLDSTGSASPTSPPSRTPTT